MADCKYQNRSTGQKFRFLRTAAKAANMTQAEFKARLGRPGFRFSKIVKPHKGGGMGLFRRNKTASPTPTWW